MSKKELLFFGVRLQRLAKSEYVVFSFDYDACILSFAYGPKNVFIPFAYFKEVKQYENRTLELCTSFEEPSVINIIAQSDEDFSNLFQLLDNVIENQDQLIEGSTLFTNLFEAFKPKICLRRSEVTVKSIRIKGQKGKLGTFVKKTVKKTDVAVGRSIDVLILTEIYLLCFEENSPTPIYIFPVSELKWKRPSDDTVSFTCNGDKASFHFSDSDACSMWFDACLLAPRVEEQEIMILEPIVKDLQKNFATPFDKENKEHVQLLRRLWEAASLGYDEEQGHIPFAIQHTRWQIIGFQRDDPVSDLRASGLLGLQNLVYFAEKYTGLFLQMARGQLLVETDMYYPFATAGINISYLMVKLLNLKKGMEWYPTMQLYPMFFYNKRAWEELYTIIFRLFDQKWKQMGLGYMGFQQVIDATEEGVSELIKKKSVMGVPAIFDMLGILLEDLDSFRNPPESGPPIRRSVTMIELSGSTRSPRRATISSEVCVNVSPILTRDVSAAKLKQRSGKRCHSALDSARRSSQDSNALFLSPRLLSKDTDSDLKPNNQ